MTISGFGRLSVAKRAASQARNPRTAVAIDVPYGHAPWFGAGMQLKRVVAEA